MNIKVEKKKYIAPCMEVLNFTRESCLLISSEYEDDNGVDIDDFGPGYDGGMN